MSFRLRIKYFLIHRLNYTNKTAAELISSGKLTVNGKVVRENEFLAEEDELELNGQILKKKRIYSYYAIYKPVGIESTFNTKIKDNLGTVFPFNGDHIIAGRLDKASEGLMLISNDGKWVNAITRPENDKEKEYEVEVDKEIDEEFIVRMGNGVNIGFYVTKACEVKKTGEKNFIIILKEGKNKQIRRMCKKLGYKVERLKRVRIDKFHLFDLQALEYKIINP
jgi:23S rRNA pseudouridine2604 synthase